MSGAGAGILFDAPRRDSGAVKLEAAVQQ